MDHDEDGDEKYLKTKKSYRGPAPPIIFGITLFTFFPSRRHDRHGNFVREEKEEKDRKNV